MDLEAVLAQKIGEGVLHWYGDAVYVHTRIHGIGYIAIRLCPENEKFVNDAMTASVKTKKK